jgi:hypothetical protein
MKLQMDGAGAASGMLGKHDRIIEVDGKTGNAVEQIRAWAAEHKETVGSLRLKVARRPVTIHSVTVRLQPGEFLGLDVDLASTNTIQHIDAGRVAELNAASPGLVEVDDRILEVDGKPGYAVDQIRAWVQDHRDTEGDLTFKVARPYPPHAEDGSIPDSAWSFSVMVRVHPGESLGVGIGVDNVITEIEAKGAVPSVNAAHPGSLQVGDRIVAVDGIARPLVDSTAKLEAWFLGRQLYSKDIPRDLRFTVLRPVQPKVAATVLPPVEHGLVPSEWTAVPSEPAPELAKPDSKEEPVEDGQSAGTVSTTDLRQVPEATSAKLESPESGRTGLAKPAVLPTVAESGAGGDGWCCAASSDRSQQLTVNGKKQSASALFAS